MPPAIGRRRGRREIGKAEKTKRGGRVESVHLGSKPERVSSAPRDLSAQELLESKRAFRSGNSGDRRCRPCEVQVTRPM